MKNWLYLLRREFRLFWKNNVLKAIFIGGPLLYGILFGFVYQKGKVTDLPILVVDMDRSPISDKLLDMLIDNEAIHVARVKYDDVHVEEEMISLNAHAVVIIPEHFEADILQRRNPEVIVNINMANILTANYASRAIQIVLGTMSAGIEIETLKRQGVSESQAARLYEPFINRIIIKTTSSRIFC